MIMAMIKNILITMEILMTIKILALVTLKAHGIAGNNNNITDINTHPIFSTE